MFILCLYKYYRDSVHINVNMYKKEAKQNGAGLEKTLTNFNSQNGKLIWSINFIYRRLFIWFIIYEFSHWLHITYIISIVVEQTSNMQKIQYNDSIETERIQLFYLQQLRI